MQSVFVNALKVVSFIAVAFSVKEKRQKKRESKEERTQEKEETK